MKQVRNILFISSVTLPVFLLTFLHCQHFSNPFENNHNADVHILPKTTFSTEFTDTLTIFSNDTLYVTTTVPELIDSFHVKATNNRFFSDTTIIAPAAQLYAFRISSYDTGNQSITIDDFQKDKTPPSRTILFYVKNQLFQKDLLNQNLNDTLLLQTTPVEDNVHVVYTWILNQMEVPSPFSHTKVTPYLMDNKVHNGRLYVSDSLFKSPDKTFTFSFSDTKPPTIICLNKGLNDTTRIIRTPDSVIVFRVTIYDGKERQPAEYVTFNNKIPKYASDLIYSEVIQNVKTFTEEHPYLMVVKAIDNEIFGNVSTDTFRIIYDSSAITPDTTLITIHTITGDSLSTSANPVIISGSLSNSSSKSIILKCFTNNALVFDAPYPEGNGTWTVSCRLVAGFNNFFIKAYDNATKLLAEKLLTINYSTDIIDTTPPVILSASINGIVGKAFYVGDDSSLIKFYAFDYGSGIQKVLIDNVEQPVRDSQFLWTNMFRYTGHEWKTVKIALVDKKENRAADSLQIKHNIIPSIKIDSLPYAIATDTTYYRQLYLFDPDNDTLSVIISHQPADMIFSDNFKEFTWKAKSTHTGPDSLVAVVYDGIQQSQKHKWYYNVYDPSLSNASIHIAEQKNIPAFLIAHHDTLNLNIQIGEPAGIPPYRFRTRISKNSGALEYASDDGKINWIPQLEDTGTCQIRVVVKDALQHSDTLITQFIVIPPNTDTADLLLKGVINAKIIDSTTMTLNLNDSICFLNFEIRDNDHPLTEKYHVTSTINNSTTSFTQLDKQFQVIVNGSILIDDTVIVTLKDSTRLKPDTLRFTIVNIIENPNLIGGLARWYLPKNLISNFYNTTWKDYTNSTNDLYGYGDISSQSNSLNGLPVIALSSAYFSNMQGGNWMANQFSIYVVASYDELPPGANQALVSNFGTSYPNSSAYALGVSSGGEVVAFTTGSGPAAATTVKTGLSTKKQNWYVYSFTSKGRIGTSSSMSINTGLNQNFSEITTSDFPDKSNIAIGTNIAPGNKWAGKIAEIIQYDRNLSPLESKKVIGYLMNKYGLK